MVSTSQLGFPLPAGPVQGNQFTWNGGSAVTITVDTPTQYLPGVPILVTGTYTGTPLGFNYKVNGSGNAIQANAVSLDAFGNYSFYINAGLAAGTYTLQVIDLINPNITGTSGSFTVSTFNPYLLASGNCIWDMDPNDRTLTMVNGYASGNAIIQSIKNKVNNTQYLTAHNGYPSGVPILLSRDLGTDSLHTALAMKVRTTSPLSTYDPTTNQFQAGGLNGPCASLIRLLASLPTGPTMALTCITAVYFSATIGATFNAGLLAICTPSSPNEPFIQLTPRNDTTKIGGEIVDNNGVIAEGDITTYPPAPGWYVLTTLIGGGQIITRINKTAGTAGSTTAIGSVSRINEFSLGGDGGNLTVLNGAAYEYFGRQMLYQGTLSGTDLTGAETLVGNSVGLSI